MAQCPKIVPYAVWPIQGHLLPLHFVIESTPWQGTHTSLRLQRVIKRGIRKRMSSCYSYAQSRQKIYDKSWLIILKGINSFIPFYFHIALHWSCSKCSVKFGKGWLNVKLFAFLASAIKPNSYLCGIGTVLEVRFNIDVGPWMEACLV